MNGKKTSRLPGFVRGLIAFVFWIGVWWILSAVVGKEVLVPSPPVVAEHLFSFFKTGEFYLSVLSTLGRILGGFTAAVLLGTALGILCARVRAVDTLISPLMSVIRSTPVASFIILALVWIDKNLIPAAISALMVLPVLFGNVKAGVLSADPKLLEMAAVFRFSRKQKLSRIYFPAVAPYLTAGLKTCLGLAWKAGVAAEVLSLAASSIGLHLYESKVYLETADMFAWTLVVILLSLLIEKGMMSFVLYCQKKGRLQPVTEGGVTP
ncbi:MAG: ABC transporter permease subunit [Clostridia bacterium]|nr:ABC transporter permease subunit [Clostridia bacterium]